MRLKLIAFFSSYLGVKMKLPIYLDYAATCPVDERVAKKNDGNI